MSLSEEEQLRILERAEWLYEVGIPGLGVGGIFLFLSLFLRDHDMLATGVVVLAISVTAIKVGQYYKDKVLP